MLFNTHDLRNASGGVEMLDHKGADHKTPTAVAAMSGKVIYLEGNTLDSLSWGTLR